MSVIYIGSNLKYLTQK